MGKKVLSILVLFGVLILGLLVWNIHLSNQVNKLRKTLGEQEFKNGILEGDNDVLTYDLVTCRDSLRILNKIVDK